MTNVLVVTTTMRMLNWVHSHTTNLRPAVALHTELVVSISGLKEWLLSSATASNLTNHGTAVAWDDFLSTRWELNPEI
jgi:hypothetical protein